MKGKKAMGKGLRTLVNILIALAFGLVYFYFRLPAINLHDPAFYTMVLMVAVVFFVLSVMTLGLFRASTGTELWEGIKLHARIPLLIVVALALIYFIGNALSWPIFRSGAYRDLLTVVEGDFTAEVEEISYNQIPMLDSDSAKKLGDKKMGELADMVSQFEVADDYTQINFRGRPVRVTPLEYGDIFKWMSNRSEGLPAFIVIDMVTQEADAIRLGEGMKYTTTEYFFRNVERNLRFKYPTMMFDSPCFEIDDEGTPYWICPRVIKRIGLFGGTDIEGAVLMNAITGECVYYEDVPGWVDRVFRADLIIQQYDYHGIYQNGWFNSFIGQKDVTVTTDGYNYIAIEDDVYLYTGITSVNSDDSNIGFILTNQRTKETKYYSCAGAHEYAAMDSAEGIVQYMEYVATFPLLLNISNQPTYFMALKDAGGLVKMYAMVNVQQYQIVASGTSVAECERSYIELLAGNGISAARPSADESVTGVISDIRTAVIEGNTHVYIRLDKDSFYYVVSVTENELAAVLSEGDKVTLEPAAAEGEIRPAYSIERAE